MGRVTWVSGAILAVALLGVILTACSRPAPPAVLEPLEGARIEISVEPGGSWIHKFTIFWFIKKNNPPQMAFWLEDLVGNHVETIYVTEVSAMGDWTNADNRPYSLPVWGRAQGIEYEPGLFMPTEDDPLPDAVTGATPRNAFTIAWAIPQDLAPGSYVVRCEVNHSTDFNDTYTGEVPGEPEDNGQPSVVWSGTLEIGEDADTIQLGIIGHGSATGDDGEIVPELSTLTTALDIIDSIVVRYLPE